MSKIDVEYECAFMRMKRVVRWLVKRAGWSAVYESEEEALKYANGGRILKLVEDRDDR